MKRNPKVMNEAPTKASILIVLGLKHLEDVDALKLRQ
jgi:hypothetical protein